MPVGWMARKLDSLAGAMVGAAGAMAASQWREYLQQYRQRLGGHLDEAEAQLVHLAGHHAVADAAERPMITEIMAVVEDRVTTLGAALRALAEAPSALQPWAFVRHLDPLAARATLEGFQPALPVDTASLAWSGAGLVVALLLYELVKGLLWAPVVVTRRAARPRAAAKGGDARPTRAARTTPALSERREPTLES